MMSCALLGMVLTSLEELRSGWHGVNDAGLCFVAGDDADLEEGAGRVGADEHHEAIVEVVVADGVGGGVANVGGADSMPVGGLEKDRKSGVEGKRRSVRVELGGGGNI